MACKIKRMPCPEKQRPAARTLGSRRASFAPRRFDSPLTEGSLKHASRMCVWINQMLSMVARIDVREFRPQATRLFGPPKARFVSTKGAATSQPKATHSSALPQRNKPWKGGTSRNHAAVTPYHGFAACHPIIPGVALGWLVSGPSARQQPVGSDRIARSTARTNTLRPREFSSPFQACDVRP